MGTSSRQPAPTGGQWTQAKTRLTNWTRSGGGNDDLVRAALGAFVGALGGATAAARASAGGVQAGAGLGEFLADVSRAGLETTLERYGLNDLVGSEPLEVLNEIASRVAGAGNSPEEAVAREAVLTVLAELFSDAENFDEMDAIAIDIERLLDLLARYLTEYIYGRVVHDLGDRIADNAATPEEAARLEQRVHAQIRDLVALDLSEIDPLEFDWQSPAGQDRLRDLLADAFRMISAGE